MPEIQLRGAEVDGLTLHYVTEGRGPAVVLVHGLGGFAESWRHNIPALARVATVYAVDLPGGGRRRTVERDHSAGAEGAARSQRPARARRRARRLGDEAVPPRERAPHP